MSAPWRLLLVGFGTVGRGVAERLLGGREELLTRGCDARVVGIVDPVVGSVADATGLDLAAVLARADAGERIDSVAPHLPDDVEEALMGVDADVVVEVTPTNLEDGQPGIDHVRAALRAGCHVITTNKGPVALAWPELSRLAADRGVMLRCEGTVLSGTPVLGLAEVGLAGAGIRSIRGIVNGTCNHILTEMEAGCSYEEALADAQARGYAETDPTGDVEGWDAAAKVVILANLVVGADLALADVERVGITRLDGDDIAAARDEGQRWRLVASVTAGAGGVAGAVRPERVAADDPLAAVVGPGNLLAFETAALGRVTVAGPGAGRGATGHAVVADLLAIHRAFPR